MQGRARRAERLWLVGVTALIVASVASGNGCGMMSETGGMPDDDDDIGTAGNGGEGGGMTSTTSSGVGYKPPIEDCLSNECPRPEEPPCYPVSVGESLSLDGNTDGRGDDYSSFCGDEVAGAGEDVVYSLQAEERGTLTISASSALAQPVVYVEEVCGIRTTFGLPPDQLPCLDTAGQEIRLGVTPGQPLFLIVEGGGSDGDYQVDVELAEPFCGDGVINPADDVQLAEQCDFGPGGTGGGPAADNGCDANCRFEPAPSDQDRCPGADVAALVGQPIAGFTVGYADDFQPGCVDAGGPDRLYHLWLELGEVVQVDVAADFDVALGLMTECDAGQQPTHCVDSAGVSTAETLQFTATDAGFHYIVVDGFDGASWGTFTLTVTKS